MNDFIVTCPSDFNSKIHKNNTLSHFKIDYDIPFNLSKDYEVGIVEIIYPTNIKNVPNDVHFYLKLEQKPLLVEYKNNYLYEYKVQSGNYSNVNNLYTEITNQFNNLTLKSIENDLKKIYSNYEITVTILPTIKLDKKRIQLIEGDVIFKSHAHSFTAHIYFCFDNYLHFMLGFSLSDRLHPKDIAKYNIDLFGNNHCLFIYTNIIQPSFVGNEKAQLLRIIPNQKPTNDSQQMKVINFNPIIFHPVQSQIFDLIEIQIRDSTGHFVIFESGKTIVTLMFREKQQI